jgi:hypothetical protein
VKIEGFKYLAHLKFFTIENGTNFKEERSTTIEREQSFKNWPHSSPSRISMLTAGWSLDTTKGIDFTTCPHCGVECNGWEPNDDSLRIHRGWSPSCPFILAEHPIHPSSVAIKALDKVYTNERIADDVVKPMPKVIMSSNSLYAKIPERLNSFSSFPGGPPENVNALVQSGFYCVKTDTLLQCYYCGGLVKDFHQYPSNEINNIHNNRFQHCCLAQMLCEEIGTNATSKLIIWCCK